MFRVHVPLAIRACMLGVSASRSQSFFRFVCLSKNNHKHKKGGPLTPPKPSRPMNSTRAAWAADALSSSSAEAAAAAAEAAEAAEAERMVTSETILTNKPNTWA